MDFVKAQIEQAIARIQPAANNNWEPAIRAIDDLRGALAGLVPDARLPGDLANDADAPPRWERVGRSWWNAMRGTLVQYREAPADQPADTAGWWAIEPSPVPAAEVPVFEAAIDAMAEIDGKDDIRTLPRPVQGISPAPIGLCAAFLDTGDRADEPRDTNAPCLFLPVMGFAVMEPDDDAPWRETVLPLVLDHATGRLGVPGEEDDGYLGVTMDKASATLRRRAQEAFAERRALYARSVIQMSALASEPEDGTVPGTP